MKARYRLIRRRNRGNTFYCVDSITGSRTSCTTTNPDEARRLVHAKNEAENQPMLNLQIAKAYLLGADSSMAKRTWGHAMIALTNSKQGSNKERWERAAKDKALVPLLARTIVETRAEELLRRWKSAVSQPIISYGDSTTSAWI